MNLRTRRTFPLLVLSACLLLLLLLLLLHLLLLLLLLLRRRRRRLPDPRASLSPLKGICLAEEDVLGGSLLRCLVLPACIELLLPKVISVLILH